jgi:hypothetical protein
VFCRLHSTYALVDMLERSDVTGTDEKRAHSFNSRKARVHNIKL